MERASDERVAEATGMNQSDFGHIDPEAMRVIREQVARADREKARADAAEARVKELGAAALSKLPDGDDGNGEPTAFDYHVVHGEMTRCKAQRDAAIRKVSLLHDATIVLRNGMGGYGHFDPTQQNGSGCPVCIVQRKARAEATRLIDEANNIPPELERAMGGDDDAAKPQE